MYTDTRTHTCAHTFVDANDMCVQAIGGMRGIKSMITETSLLDAEHVCTVYVYACVRVLVSNRMMIVDTHAHEHTHHTCTHTRTRTTHTYINTCIAAVMHTHKHTHVYTYPC